MKQIIINIADKSTCPADLLHFWQGKVFDVQRNGRTEKHSETSISKMLDLKYANDTDVIAGPFCWLPTTQRRRRYLKTGRR